MARFKYTAADPADPTNRITAEIEANTQQEAFIRIQEKGYQPLEIEEAGKGIALGSLDAFKNRVKDQQLAFITRQMATMINAGLSPLETLSVLIEATQSQALRNALAGVKEEINQGSSPSEAMRAYPKIFDEQYCSLVSAGEASGDLPGSLFRLADALDKQAKFKREVRSAMSYPVGVLVFAMIIVIIMLMVVVPQFAAMFSDLGGNLPAPTAFLVKASNFLKSATGIISLFVAPPVFFFLFRKYISTEGGRRQWDTFKLKMKPKAFANLVEKVCVARLMRALSTLYGAGIPVTMALRISGPTTNNQIVLDKVKQATEDINQGSSLAEAFQENEVVPPMACAMLLAGEKSGEVSKMLEKVAEVYEEEVEAAVEGIKAMIEPMLMMVIGGIVGSVVVSLYLPMFSIYDQIAS